MTQLLETGQYDRRGIPIHYGDLIRVPHYVHYRDRRQMWAYYRVVERSGWPCLRVWDDMRPDSHACALIALTDVEILADDGRQRDEQGGYVTWNERPRKKGKRNE
jgi:hypothetical protein